MMDEIKLRDAYDEFAQESWDETLGEPLAYVEGYRDGAYDFFEKLLGMPS